MASKMGITITVMSWFIATPAIALQIPTLTSALEVAVPLTHSLNLSSMAQPLFNASRISHNMTNGSHLVLPNELEPVCDETGSLQMVGSCMNAWMSISPSTSPHTYGERGTGEYDVLLPARVVSCK